MLRTMVGLRWKPAGGAWALARTLYALVLAAGCATKTQVDVPMVFRPTEGLLSNVFSSSLPDSTIYVGDIVDKRDRQDLIGENREESKDVPIYA